LIDKMFISVCMHLHIMSVKTITIKDEVYRALLEFKGEGESFSAVLMKLIKKEGSPMDFFGLLKKSSSLDEIEKEILEERKKARLRDVFS